ncbi:MAG: hypothetical protein P3A28_01760 [Gemmatimonadota bacterium]|nr:hypothetical protein [Gemmatimonadota bacterium]
MRTATFAGLLVFVAVSAAPAASQEGLAASALANSEFSWVRRAAPGFRVYFQAGSYAAQHQDSLLARLPMALQHARTLIRSPAPADPIDLFFVETREAMTRLVGARATGFTHQSARAVFLMTNPTWRAFERHEIMHVVAWHAWGPPAARNDWLQEGLAQAADGRCGEFSNEAVLRGLTRRHGWVTLQDMLVNFRQQPDLRAYLQAAALTRFLLDAYGPTAVETLWRNGGTADSIIGDRSFAAIEQQWREVIASGDQPAPQRLAAIDEVGCGVVAPTR